MHVYVGADHRGYELKNQAIEWLRGRQISFTDFGANAYNIDDDYNDYTKKVTSALLADGKEDSFGLLFCGSAQGIAMQANRFRGIRAAICYNPAVSMESRGHNAANVACIPADDVDAQAFADIFSAFISTQPLSDPKYQRRNQKLDED